MSHLSASNRTGEVDGNDHAHPEHTQPVGGHLSVGGQSSAPAQGAVTRPVDSAAHESQEVVPPPPVPLTDGLPHVTASVLGRKRDLGKDSHDIANAKALRTKELVSFLCAQPCIHR